MDLQEFTRLVQENRSCRRFDNQFKIETSRLKELVNLARMSPSAANKQPLKYIISRDDAVNEKIFSCLGWAAYLKDWKGPEPAERPSAYVVILADHSIADNFWCDHGICSQTILLGARACGLAGCIFGAVNKKQLSRELEIPEHLEIKLVLAIGKPVEKQQIDPVGEDGDIRYFRDENQVHHVPKRDLDDLIIQSW